MRDGPLPKVTTNEAPKEEAKTQIIALLEKHELDIESISQNIISIKAQIDQIPNVVQTVVMQVLNQLSQTPVTPKDTPTIMSNNPLSRLDPQMQAEVLGKVIDKVLGKVLGDSQPANFLGLDETFIQEKMRNSVISNFELGESLVEAVKSGFKRKTVGKMVSNAVEHGIE